MFQVAVYGKGGIGKSTLSANISVTLAGGGARVVQVGCDPKHDSTRLLLGGRAQRTVLDYVRETPRGKRRLEDVLEEGTAGVMCAESGGPEPGIGCAGRGILTTFDELGRMGLDSLDADYRLYDVLGDVVCGGFAVPLRQGYADGVVIVTSGEFMALYAANNIICGMGNFPTGGPRLLGVVLNRRGVEGEAESVARFAEAAGTRVIADIPRDPLFARAEAEGHTLAEMFPDSGPAEQVRRVAGVIEAAARGEPVMTDPHPLDDDQMSDLAAGRPIRPPSGEVPSRTGCGGCRRSISDARVLSSCAAYGAVSAFCRTGDTAVIIHGPDSCAYLMSTTRAKAVLELYAQGLYPRPPRNDIRCTSMDSSSGVFGGSDRLRGALEAAVADGCGRIAVVTTCMPGIMGDDSAAIASEVAASHPGTDIALVEADGDVAGEYTDGFMMAVERIVDRIDPSVEPEDGLVNLVSTSFFDIQTPSHAAALDGMLAAFGLRVNCRLLDDGSPAPPEDFCRASLDILMGDTRNNRELAAMIGARTGRVPFPEPMPLGIREYASWLRAMGERTGRSDAAEAEVARAEAEYRGFVEAHRGRMGGRTAIVMWKMGASPDWLVDTLGDLGVEVLRIGVVPSPTGRRGAPVSRHAVTRDYDEAMLADDLARLRPDLLISDIVHPVPEGTTFAKLNRMGVGYLPVLEYVEYLENSMRLPAVEGWRARA